MRLAGDLIVESVIEEEATGNGTLACVERGYRADFALIAEPTSLTYVEAQVGLMWFEVMVAGDPRHPSQARTGRANAIDKAFVLAQALAGLEDRWNAEKSKHPLFERVERPIVIYVGKIEGGDWTSSVPAWCRFEVRVGAYPGMGARSDCRTEVERCLLDASASDPFLAPSSRPRSAPRGQYGDGYVLAGGHRGSGDAPSARIARCSRATWWGGHLERLVGRAHPRHRAGRTPTPFNTARSAATIHGYDEAVDLESLRRVTQSIALFAADWCGVEAA